MGTKTHRRALGAPSPRTTGVQDMGVPLDESGSADGSVPDEHVRGEFRCSDCGYGAVVRRGLPPCPMCGGTAWESRGSAAPRPVG
jgi:hypothetical protein